MKGTIIKIISNDYTIESNDNIYVCKPRGILKNRKEIPKVGDQVEIDIKKKIINKIYPRKNDLIRPPVANIDYAIIVTSVKEPDLDTYLLDKSLTIISYNNITPIIYFTKLDLIKDRKEIDEYIKYYKKIGYITLTTKEELLPIIKNKIVILTGQSGAGKSTLLNKLDPTLNLKTNSISKSLGRGKHTTRHTELYRIDKTYIADTPGFSKLDLINMTNIDIRDNMKEFFDNLEKCKYKDCIHIKEDNCYIKDLVEKNIILKSRYENYKSFIEKGD